MESLTRISSMFDELVGTQGSLGYVAIAVLVVWGYWYSASSATEDNTHSKTTVQSDDEDKVEPDPPRNFTLEQLHYFDGKPDDMGHDKPVYMSVAGTVFDVSDGRNFYGPDGPYCTFAGHECGAALAKMSFDNKLLDDLPAIEALNFGEKTELEGWVDKFTNYRCYPIKGKLVPKELLPNPQRIVSKEELAKHNGTGETPNGYAAAPIYVGAGDRVFDMSFGGVAFYGGPDKPYGKFAGRDATRALAKMSLDDSDLQTSDTADLTEKQLKTLNDWIKTFEERKRYPVVGRLEK